MAEETRDTGSVANLVNGGCSAESTSGPEDEAERFLDRIHRETRHQFAQTDEVLGEAKRIRDAARETEEELLRWEARVRAERPIGTRWAEMIGEAKAMVARISLRLVEDLERQREALGHFRAAHVSVRSRTALKRLRVPKGALSSLGRSERLRAEAVESTQMALDQSERILSYEARQGPLELLPMLSGRRRLFADAETMLRGALNAEAEAFQAADRGISSEEWRAKDLEAEVARLHCERKTFERRIKYLEDTRSELEKARDEALAMIAREREEKVKLESRASQVNQATHLRPGSGKLEFRLAPASRLASDT